MTDRPPLTDRLPTDPTPEEIARSAKDIRERGFTNRRGQHYWPWCHGRYPRESTPARLVEVNCADVSAAMSEVE